MKISKNITSFATVISGSTIAQALSLAFAPVVSRLYTPNDFGIAALFFSVITVMLPILSLRYNHAIFLPKKDDDAIKLLQLCFLIISAMTTIFLIIIFVLAMTDSLFFLEKIGNWIYLLPFALFIFATLELGKISCTRWQHFKHCATSEIVQSSTTPLLRIIFGLFFNSTVWGLIVSMILAVISASATLFMSILKNISQADKIKMGEVVAFLKDYKEFPLYTLPTALLFALSDNMTIFLFGNFFSVTVVGLLAMTRRLVRIPVTTISNAMRTVLTPQIIARVNKNERIFPLYIKISLLSFLLLIIPFALLAKYATLVFSFVLGKEWVIAGRYASLLVPVMLTQLTATPVAIFLLALRRQKVRLILQITFFLLTFSVAVYSFYISNDPEKTLWAYSLAGCLANCISIITAGIIIYKWDKMVPQQVI